MSVASLVAEAEATYVALNLTASRDALFRALAATPVDGPALPALRCDAGCDAVGATPFSRERFEELTENEEFLDHRSSGSLQLLAYAAQRCSLSLHFALLVLLHTWLRTATVTGAITGATNCRGCCVSSHHRRHHNRPAHEKP